MYHLRLIKALSYTGLVSATQKNPDTFTEDNPYFDSAIRIYNKIFQASLEVKLEEWLDKYLGG